MDYFISDTHFCHNKMITDLERRPFRDVAHMDETMIRNWNQVVKKQDRVYVAGDFTLSNKEGTAQIIARLKGYKILVMGNHDRSRSRQWWLDAGFHQVIEYPILYQGLFMISHEPVDDIGPFYNLHGHIHSKTFRGSTRHFNLSVERLDYRPVSLETIKRTLGISA